jgi:hypothetical protein
VHFVDKEPSQKRIDFVDKLNIEIKKNDLKRNLKKGIF